MTNKVPRLRMFAGPNGSGKSTIKSLISPDLIGIYINPDDIELEIRKCGFLDFQKYEVQTTDQEVLNFFSNSSFLLQAGLIEEVSYLRFNDNKLIFRSEGINSYLASVTVDFIRHKLIKTGVSFSFETVMSSPDKIEFLRKAKTTGYRTYLYYVATEDPEINISRVRQRVMMGGHSVPEEKIISRYGRSLDLLMQAVQATNRAFIFDNSKDEYRWVAEITNEGELEMKTDIMPLWFKKALWMMLPDTFRVLFSGFQVVLLLQSRASGAENACFSHDILSNLLSQCSTCFSKQFYSLIISFKTVPVKGCFLASKWMQKPCSHPRGPFSHAFFVKKRYLDARY